MHSKQKVLAAVFSVATCCGLAGLAQRPATNVAPSIHPNIAAAQDLIVRASNRISMAQRSNEWDMNGHAQRAKDLLAQASNELKMAAETANVK